MWVPFGVDDDTGMILIEWQVHRMRSQTHFSKALAFGIVQWYNWGYYYDSITHNYVHGASNKQKRLPDKTVFFHKRLRWIINPYLNWCKLERTFLYGIGLAGSCIDNQSEPKLKILVENFKLI